MEPIATGGQQVYGIGIALGATHTSVTILREGRISSPHLDGPVAMVPTAAFVEPDGRIVCGGAALTRIGQEPKGAARRFLERIGTGETLSIGDGRAARTYRPEDIAGALIAWVVATVSATNATPPAHLAVAHPVWWHGHQVEALRAALVPHGLAAAHLIGEHLACGKVSSTLLRTVPGQPFAILDIGGTGMRCAVLRADVGGSVWPLGRPNWSPEAAGDEHDDALLNTLAHAVDPDGSKRLRARDGGRGTDRLLDGLSVAARRAKERLSHTARTDLIIDLDGRRFDVTITREALEAAIAPSIDRSVALLEQTLDASGVTVNDLGSLFLAGGAGQIPLLAAQLTARLGRDLIIAREADPALSAAAGAILAVPGLATTLARGERPATAATPVGAGAGSQASGRAASGRGLPAGRGQAEAPVRSVVAPREPTAPAPRGRPVLPRRAHPPLPAELREPSTTTRRRPTPRTVIPPRALGSIDDLID